MDGTPPSPATIQVQIAPGERLAELAFLAVLGRLLLACVLGAAIGLQRELARNTAGLRTHLLVSLGSCLIMLTSQHGFNEDPRTGDPARMAAQVVSGIGFLGAGAIIRRGPVVRGLTTAASLWVSAGLGLAVGTGYWIAALLTTTLTIVSLVVLKAIERSFISPRETRVVSMHDVTWDQVQACINQMRKESIVILSIKSASSDTPVAEDATPLVNVDLVVRLPKSASGSHMVDTLSTIIVSSIPQLEHAPQAPSVAAMAEEGDGTSDDSRARKPIAFRRARAAIPMPSVSVETVKGAANDRRRRKSQPNNVSHSRSVSRCPSPDGRKLVDAIRALERSQSPPRAARSPGVPGTGATIAISDPVRVVTNPPAISLEGSPEVSSLELEFEDEEFSYMSYSDYM
ncbi:MgtC family protein [Thecamonas trahens ATCC 50062]|uniref:MgtC family protein n=1 Tax=Thecamonas trahens ATCC 50062 TaxID=461836 RepID=A0A0L0DB28_THETB|nr:MgtC family protein [Thecamonas trahens ATCC 50062]KNC49445.1 MgtC family protein [Thecamonas trahens ATCC 50062]|eukprot:XP_013757866.1 MgtC family protein [Thecamonas trahens ATCC 50062]